MSDRNTEKNEVSNLLLSEISESLRRIAAALEKATADKPGLSMPDISPALSKARNAAKQTATLAKGATGKLGKVHIPKISFPKRRGKKAKAIEGKPEQQEAATAEGETDKATEQASP